jgi:hypothetical protein
MTLEFDAVNGKKYYLSKRALKHIIAVSLPLNRLEMVKQSQF